MGSKRPRRTRREDEEVVFLAHIAQAQGSAAVSPKVEDEMPKPPSESSLLRL